MAIPAGLVRFTIAGTTASGEIFNTSIWFDGYDISTQADADAAATEFAVALNTNHANLDAVMSNDTVIHTVKAYCYTSTGGSGAAFIGEASLTVTGSGAASNALQLCVVITLLTGHAGRSNRGRMYWPANGVDLTNHQLTQALCTGLASDMKAVCEAVLGGSSAAVPVVVSQKLDSSQHITLFRVDSRLDIQRRRANKQAALFTGQATFP